MNDSPSMSDAMTKVDGFDPYVSQTSNDAGSGPDRAPAFTVGRDDADMSYALRVSDVGKAYTSGFRLHDITFDLPKGYIMGLIGPNGAGKSTLIKLILNMVHRDCGSVEVLGLDCVADEIEIKQQLGIVFDTSYFPEYWKVDTVCAAFSKVYDGFDRSVFDGYVRRFDIDPKKRVKDLSRGMQMKLMLAGALSHDAKLLILDEPTSGLDVLARDELMDILSQYIGDGERSVLFSTHVTSDLERSADFITYITDGTIFYSGPKDEFTDGFYLVKGAPEDLAGIQEMALGVHRYPTGFDALVQAEHINRVPGSGYIIEPVNIDDIIRLTNPRGEGSLRDESSRRGNSLNESSRIGSSCRAFPESAIQEKSTERRDDDGSDTQGFVH